DSTERPRYAARRQCLRELRTKLAASLANDWATWARLPTRPGIILPLRGEVHHLFLMRVSHASSEGAEVRVATVVGGGVVMEQRNGRATLSNCFLQAHV